MLAKDPDMDYIPSGEHSNVVRKLPMGYRVDGNDLLAVYQATKEARRMALQVRMEVARGIKK